MYSSFCRNIASVSITFGWLPSCHNWNGRSPLCRALWYSRPSSRIRTRRSLRWSMTRRAVYDLKSPTCFGQVLGRGDEVDVVLEDDVTQERQAALVLEELPGVEQDLDGLRPR